VRYRVLDDIVYEKSRDGNGQAVIATAAPGDVVELNEKDASALARRGAVEPATRALKE
jgi:hypothetical protein